MIVKNWPILANSQLKELIMCEDGWSELQEKLSEANGFFSAMEEAKINRINLMINWIKNCLPQEETEELIADGLAGGTLFKFFQKMKERGDLGLIGKILKEQGYLKPGQFSVEESLKKSWWPCHSNFPYNQDFFDSMSTNPLPAKIQMQMPAATITIGNSISVVKVGVGNTG